MNRRFYSLTLTLACFVLASCASMTVTEKGHHPRELTSTQKTHQEASEMNRLLTIKRRLIRESFPELKNTRIQLKLYPADTESVYSMTCRPGLNATVLTVNRAIFERNISDTALESVLAHELSHAVYYEEHSFLHNISLIEILWNDTFRAKFERRTDLETIRRGYARGLIAYKKWLYSFLTNSERARKKRLYFTPEEVRVMTEALDKNSKLYQYWQKDVPLSIEDVRTDIQNTPVKL